MNSAPGHEVLQLAEIQGHLQWADSAMQGLCKLLAAAPPETMISAAEMLAMIRPVADSVADARHAAHGRSPS